MFAVPGSIFTPITMAKKAYFGCFISALGKNLKKHILVVGHERLDKTNEYPHYRTINRVYLLSTFYLKFTYFLLRKS